MQRLGVQDRVKGMSAQWKSHIPKEEFDLIWSEGAIYYIGLDAVA